MFNPQMVSSVQSALSAARGEVVHSKTAAPGARGGGATTAFAKAAVADVFGEDGASEGEGRGFAFAEPVQAPQVPAVLTELLSIEEADQFVFGEAA